MSNTTVIRPVGSTTAIGVSNSSSTAVTISWSNNDQVNFASFLNTNSFPVAVNIAQSSAGAAVLPTAGNSSVSYVLGVSMSQPIVLSVPNQSNSFSVTAICGGANTGTIYVTPVGDQS